MVESSSKSPNNPPNKEAKPLSKKSTSPSPPPSKKSDKKPHLDNEVQRKEAQKPHNKRTRSSSPPNKTPRSPSPKKKTKKYPHIDDEVFNNSQQRLHASVLVFNDKETDDVYIFKPDDYCIMVADNSDYLVRVTKVISQDKLTPNYFSNIDTFKVSGYNYTFKDHHNPPLKFNGIVNEVYDEQIKLYSQMNTPQLTEIFIEKYRIVKEKK